MKVINLASLFFPPALVFFFCSAIQAQELPSDWSSAYVAHEWQGKCEQVGRGGCREGNTYFYDSGRGLLVRFVTYDQRVTQLFVSSTKGSCAGGRLSIDGTLAMKLTGNGSYCSVAGGKQFREAERVTNPQSQLDIGMFRLANTIEVDIDLSNGDKLSAEIPMQGFGEKLDAANK